MPLPRLPREVYQSQRFGSAASVVIAPRSTPSFLSGFSRPAAAPSLAARLMSLVGSKGDRKRAECAKVGEGKKRKRERVAPLALQTLRMDETQCHNGSLQPQNRRGMFSCLSGYPYRGARAYLEARFQGEGNRAESGEKSGAAGAKRPATEIAQNTNPQGLPKTRARPPYHIQNI